MFHPTYGVPPAASTTVRVPMDHPLPVAAKRARLGVILVAMGAIGFGLLPLFLEVLRAEQVGSGTSLVGALCWCFHTAGHLGCLASPGMARRRALSCCRCWHWRRHHFPVRRLRGPACLGNGVDFLYLPGVYLVVCAGFLWRQDRAKNGPGHFHGPACRRSDPLAQVALTLLSIP